MQESQDMQVWSPGWEDPLEEEMAAYSPENPMDKRSLEGYSPKGCKESDTTEKVVFIKWIRHSLFLE